METTLAPAVRRVSVGGIELSVREWPAEAKVLIRSGAEHPERFNQFHPFVLVHGLASNARTWDGVAARLQAAGHYAVAVDQRGHGLSDKPDTGYGFDDVTTDLKALIEAQGLERPVLAGQSWGGNVVLDFAARYPELVSGLVLVDGGFIDLSSRENGSWERISVDLKPPPLTGTPRVDMLERMHGRNPDWSDAQIEMQMGNFETLPDGTIRPWLSLDRHMQILRALWEQKPSTIYPRVLTPTLIAVADTAAARRNSKEEEIAAAALANVDVKWFENSVHDIHVQRPFELADWILDKIREGFFDREEHRNA